MQKTIVVVQCDSILLNVLLGMPHPSVGVVCWSKWFRNSQFPFPNLYWFWSGWAYKEWSNIIQRQSGCVPTFRPSDHLPKPVEKWLSCVQLTLTFLRRRRCKEKSFEAGESLAKTFKARTSLRVPFLGPCLNCHAMNLCYLSTAQTLSMLWTMAITA